MSRATENRDRGLFDVERGTDPHWRRLAEKTILAVSLEMQTFTVDDVQDRLRQIGAECPGDGRAMGPIMVALSKARYIEPTDEFRQGRQPKSHANPRRVWRRRACK